ncbi:MAG: hypothetical protein E7355_04385 [Clostridiales bacterium]|nr:hypothetical protein [Clostridiales bacterium]
MNEHYEFLGLDENATEEELAARYQQLREKYSEERWQDGEAGNEAARNLTKLDVAYAEITAARQEKGKQTTGQGSLEAVAQLLKENKVDEAQRMLDDFNERSAEWHYLQAVVFYKKNWTNDSKKQLEIAMQMDPDNLKYRNAYGKMNAKNDYERQQEQKQAPYVNSAPMHGEQMGGNICSDCMTCCCASMCANTCLNCCCPMS